MDYSKLPILPLGLLSTFVATGASVRMLNRDASKQTCSLSSHDKIINYTQSTLTPLTN